MSSKYISDALRKARSLIPPLLERAMADQSAPEHRVRLMRQHEALLVHESWTGYLFLRSDGSAFYVDEEEPGSDALPGIRDDKRALMAVVLGSERFPELRALLPERSSADPDCPSCGGSGRLPVGGKPHLLCAACGVLGWVFANDEQPLADPAWIEWAKQWRASQGGAEE